MTTGRNARSAVSPGTMARFQEIVAMSSDLEAMRRRGETETLTDLVDELLHFVALKFDNAVAILADDMVVLGVLSVVRIVKLVVFAEIHFPDEATFSQQRERAINGGARDRPVATS